MHRFARLSVCTDLPGCLYAQICQVVCMHRFARLSVCTDLPGPSLFDNVISTKPK